MDLWIRSQDREMLCKAECVDLMHDTSGYAKVFLNGKFPDLIVRAYENERALEVLDEIQQVLQRGFVIDEEIKEMLIAGAVIHDNSENIVYKMPQK